MWVGMGIGGRPGKREGGRKGQGWVEVRKG